MTLIAGIILPKGILMVSDTREMLYGTQIGNELVRKITRVTPGTILGTAGTGYSIAIAKSLRKKLFDKVPTTPTSIRKDILDEYKNQNKSVRKENPNLGPMAYILLGEYNDTSKTYTLLKNIGEDDSLFDDIEIYDQLKDTAVIGSSLDVRTFLKEDINEILANFLDQELEDAEFFMELSAILKITFEHYANQIPDINDKLYCAYLTTSKNEPVVHTYLINSNRIPCKVDGEQESEFIHLQK
ncbi:hypothetical protein [Bacillus sp. SN10]|uniref:hypothetical protein n=1 Tax=Bacillus sp. SN10 TaxID=2056493 RepID=UPI000C32F95F|nr:hypothetical protein [Bacillus sp. SN10]PKJ54694.1 hypothetical protein CWE34_13945 [Bacillus sp. SN10]